MPSIVQKLDELIKRMGGQPSGNGLSIDRKLHQLDSILSGGGGSQEAIVGQAVVGEAVVGGGQPSGNSDVVVVHITGGHGEDDGYISDKSPTEIAELARGNKIVFATYEGKYYILYGISEDQYISLWSASFVKISALDAAGTTYDRFTIEGDNANVQVNRDYIEQSSGGGSGLTDDAKDALLACFENVAWNTPDAQQYIGDLRYSLYPDWELEAEYTGGDIWVTDSLDVLKQYLTVTAQLTPESEPVVIPSSDYELDGYLGVGSNYIEVSYRGKTADFMVEAMDTLLYSWDYAYVGEYDTEQSVETVLTSDGINDPPAIVEGEGLKFTAPTQVATFISADENLDVLDKTIVLEIDYFNFVGNAENHVRLLMDPRGDASNSVGTGPLIFRSGLGWTSYGYDDSGDTGSGHRKWSDTGWGDLYDPDAINAFNGKTVGVYYGADGHTRKLYVDNELVATMDDVYFVDTTKRLKLGGITTYAESSGDQCYDMTVRSVQIYHGNYYEEGE